MRRWMGVVAGVLATVSWTAAGRAADPVPLPDGVIAANVSIDGVPVGGLTAAAARTLIVTQRIAPRYAPLVLSLQGRRMSIKPTAAGYFADIDRTVTAALEYGRTKPADVPVNVPLWQRVDREKLRAVLEFRRRDVERRPRDAALRWNGLKPRVIPSTRGLGIRMDLAVPQVAEAMLARDKTEVNLHWQRLRPAVAYIGSVIVVNRGARTLTLYRGEKRVRVFRVAVGTPRYPTPRGVFRIIQMQRNPTWFPPNSPWAKGLGPVPPGAGNPLGTRWMGTTASAVGIHGTPASYSIGTAASHGCIRMYIKEAEWLYNRVNLGTPVRIV